ncbi:MAG TPA: taurine catabolism dioxygenase TauD [Rhodospirillales bacterium]|nr:taurine catabolism dioxygenase TauD [Rhodospirillales bacterium]
MQHHSGCPFNLKDNSNYSRWREKKLSAYPASAKKLMVSLSGMEKITDSEFADLFARLKKTNMAFYSGPAPGTKETLRRIGGKFGLYRLDANLGADGDGITPLKVSEKEERSRYIPYTDRPIDWHTDGYYNTPGRRIRGMILHCASAAAEGGENALMDPEIAYILLRDENPAFIEALCHPRAMTVPANESGGKKIREAQTGSVFSFDAADGSLHMRYTARVGNIEWRDDSPTRDAVAFLKALLNGPSPYIFRHRLAPGEGLICNNVLHNRKAFKDDGKNKRLLYRARYLDRVSGAVMIEEKADNR